MGGRDHSETCEVCGCQRGGLNDLRCDCDPCETCGEVGSRDTPCRCGRRALVSIHLGCLADNLRIAGGLCAAFRQGFDEGWNCSGEGFNGEYTSKSFTAEKYERMKTDGGQSFSGWRPNVDAKPAPGWREK